MYTKDFGVFNDEGNSHHERDRENNEEKLIMLT